MAIAVRRKVRIAVVLWIVFGVVVWNVIFDHHVSTAAGRYVYEATLAFRGQAPPVTMDSVMRPAIARGVQSASIWGGLIVAVGLAAVAFGARRSARRPPADPSSGQPGSAEKRA